MAFRKGIFTGIILFGIIVGVLSATYVNTSSYGTINYTGSGYYLVGGRYQYISSISSLTYQSTSSTYPVTIQTSPGSASDYWGACFSPSYNGGTPGENGTTCTSIPAGTSSASVNLPSGTVIQYLCTAPWHGAGGYNFSFWESNGASLPGGSCYHPDITVSGPITFTANYNQVSTPPAAYPSMNTTLSVGNLTVALDNLSNINQNELPNADLLIYKNGVLTNITSAGPIDNHEFAITNASGSELGTYVPEIFHSNNTIQATYSLPIKRTASYTWQGNYTAEIYGFPVDGPIQIRSITGNISIGNNQNTFDQNLFQIGYSLNGCPTSSGASYPNLASLGKAYVALSTLYSANIKVVTTNSGKNLVVPINVNYPAPLQVPSNCLFMLMNFGAQNGTSVASANITITYNQIAPVSTSQETTAEALDGEICFNHNTGCEVQTGSAPTTVVEPFNINPNNGYTGSEYTLLGLYGTVSSGTISSGSGYAIDYSYYMAPTSSSCNSHTFSTYAGSFTVPSDWQLLYTSSFNQPSNGYQNQPIFKPLNINFRTSNACFYWVSNMASGSSGVDMESQVYAELSPSGSTLTNPSNRNSVDVQLFLPATQMQSVYLGGNVVDGPFTVTLDGIGESNSTISNVALAIYKNGVLTNITSAGPIGNQQAVIINASGSELGIYVPKSFSTYSSQKTADIQLFTPTTSIQRIYQSNSSIYPVTIQTSPGSASDYWGACFSPSYNGGTPGENGTTCTSIPAGTSSASVNLPSGTVIQYLCTAPWHGAGGYNFSFWESNGASLPGGSCYHPDITVSGPITFTANYQSVEKAIVALAVRSSLNGSLSLNGSCNLQSNMTLPPTQYPYIGPSTYCTSQIGTRIELNAIPSSGYELEDWIGTGAGSYTGSDQNITVIMNGNINETAIFTKINQTIPVSNSSNASYTLILNPGWNLFSFPMSKITSLNTYPEGCTYNDVKSPVWQLSDGNYIELNNSNVQAGTGYWVDMNSTCQITMNGTALSKLDYPVLSPGWNIIGVPYDGSFINNIRGTCGIISGPYGYNNESGYYNATFLTPGHGYLLNVANSCRLGNPAAVQLPSLPS